MDQLHRGDRVHLKPAFMSKSAHLDWNIRQGTVCSVNKHDISHYVRVVWDGNKSAQNYDARELEKI